MSGFAAWVASWQGTAAAMSGTLVAGMLIGWSAGHRPRGVSRRERRELADRAEDRAALRAAGQFRAMRETALPHRPDCPCPPGMRYHAINCPKFPSQLQGPPEVAHEWEPVHVGQALALVRPDLTDSQYTQDMGERLNRFLAEVVYRVPYSADELWSGQ